MAVQQAISTLNEKQPAVTQAANSEAEKRPLLSPPEKLPEPADNSEIASNSSEPKKASEPRVVNNVPRNADEVSPPHIVAKPSLSSIPSSPQLDAFLNKQAFVQCRKCGQEHRMSYDYFATYDHHTCAKCGFTMSTVAFSAKLAKEKQQLVKQASR